MNQSGPIIDDYKKIVKKAMVSAGEAAVADLKPAKIYTSEIAVNGFNALRTVCNDKLDNTVELIKMIRQCGLAFQRIAPSLPDSVYGPTSGAGVIFGVTGGVTEAVLRKVATDTTEKGLEEISYVGVRGLKGVKEATVSLGDKQLKIAVVSGLGNASALLNAIKAGEHFDLVEVMACPGGCILGGGQPRAEDECEREARSAGLYNADKASKIRLSQENHAVEELLASLGEKKHELLHVHYHKH
jgi:NADH-quinone oxidoreductase subunit G